MRYAIISDVHGNYPALAAVIRDAAENNADRFVFAGDYIFDLPYSNEVVDAIKSLEQAVVIQGNKEAYLKKLMTEERSGWVCNQMGVVYQTCRELRPENIAYLTQLNENCFVPLQFHGRAHVTHYIDGIFGKQRKTDCSSSNYKKRMLKQPFSHTQFLTYMQDRLKEDAVINKISDIDASVVILGHSHLQWHAYCGEKLIVNPGSCGQPLDFNIGAAYSILEDTPVELRVEEKRAVYDIEKTIADAKTTTTYTKGGIWSELVFKALRTGADYFADFFTLADTIAEDNNENGSFYSNETWASAGERFMNE